MDYFRQNQVRVKIIRIFNTYGPQMNPYDGRAILEGWTPQVKLEDGLKKTIEYLFGSLTRTTISWMIVPVKLLNLAIDGTLISSYSISMLGMKTIIVPRY